MAKVDLIITGLSRELPESELRKALAALYTKPESAFDNLCQHLYLQKKPFKLLKNVDEATAGKHRERLTQIGLQCDTSTDGLTLVPITVASEQQGTECPACEDLSQDPQVCSNCGVVMEKFSRQKQIEGSLQHKLESAERGYIRKQATYNAPPPPKKRKEKKPEPAPEPEQRSDEPLTEMLKVSYEEPKNKVLHAVLAGGLLAIAGGAYASYHFGLVGQLPTIALVAEEQQTETTQIDPATAGGAVAATGAAGGTGPETAATTSEKPEEELVIGVFEEWEKLHDSADVLHHQIAMLVEADMPGTATGLVSRVKDPLLNIYGQHYIVQQQEPTKKVNLTLSDSAAAIAALETDADKVAASLSLATTYQKFQNTEAAEIAFQNAVKFAEAIEDSEQKIIAQVAIADYMMTYGKVNSGSQTYDLATTAIAELQIDPAVISSAYKMLAQSQVKNGLTEKALETVDLISDQDVFIETQIKIGDFLSQQESETPADKESQFAEQMANAKANEEYYADDPDLQQLFENDRKFKESVSKLPFNME